MLSPATSTLLYLLLFFFFFVTALVPFCFALTHNLRLSFPSFQQNEESLVFSQNSNVDNQALQVTRNSATPSSSITNTSGQITGKDPLQLWHSSNNYSASFNTSFLLNINNFTAVDADTDSTGGGMAFYLSSHPAYSTLSNSFGEWLGLFDGSIAAPAQQQARLVAIEFDTFKDSFDPDDNHVGVDVNGSIRSVHTVSLSPLDVHLTNTSSPSGINTSVWINYDGLHHTLDVYLANQGSEMSQQPTTPIISGYTIDLRNYLPETVYVGFSASVGTILEAHCVIEWTFTSTDLPNDSTPIGLIIGCSIGGTVIGLVIALITICVIRRKRRGWDEAMVNLSSLHYGPRRFSYWELRRATKGFSEECKLGEGGFGPVYKGTLQSKSKTTEVAVKRLSQKSKQGEREFKAEVMSMGRMRHRNLVQLVGWSYSGRGRLMLVYEYLPNGSLDQWIGQADKGNAKVMGWERRYQVMKGLAAGLAYLHGEWEMVVLHRDLKPSNVMLDSEFNARIGDFGLSKLINCDDPDGSAETATIAGTPGYLAPECIEQGIVSKESDMYSVGSIAIELATGRRLSANYLHSLSRLLEDSRLLEAADPQLSSFDPHQLELLLRIGLACCHPDPPARLSIHEVVHALSSSSTPSISVPTLRPPPPPSTFSHLLEGRDSSVSLLMKNPDCR